MVSFVKMTNAKMDIFLNSILIFLKKITRRPYFVAYHLTFLKLTFSTFFTCRVYVSSQTLKCPFVPTRVTLASRITTEFTFAEWQIVFIAGAWYCMKQAENSYICSLTKIYVKFIDAYKLATIWLAIFWYFVSGKVSCKKPNHLFPSRPRNFWLRARKYLMGNRN